jgi:hypothetical protein
MLTMIRFTILPDIGKPGEILCSPKRITDHTSPGTVTGCLHITDANDLLRERRPEDREPQDPPA